MPELPEVEFARRQLHDWMVGRRIQRVHTRVPALRYPIPRDLAAQVTGRTVRAVGRRAKYLLIELSSDDVLLAHLGMSGSFRRVEAGSSPERHDHVIFDIESGATIVFNDPRRFGFLTLIEGGRAGVEAALPRLGPEPLADDFDAAALCRALRGRRGPLKVVLADQAVVAGLGNIYVVEALHRARLSPRRAAATLVTRTGEPRPQAVVLAASIRRVLEEAIGRQHRLHGGDRFRVYGREGCRCLRRGCPGVVRRVTQGGRSTFFCPVCQR